MVYFDTWKCTHPLMMKHNKQSNWAIDSILKLWLAQSIGWVYDSYALLFRPDKRKCIFHHLFATEITINQNIRMVHLNFIAGTIKRHFQFASGTKNWEELWICIKNLAGFSRVWFKHWTTEHDKILSNNTNLRIREWKW